MPLASLLALSLMAAPAPDTVIATAPPAIAPAPPKVDPAPAASASDDGIPPGAPTDDYGLVAWCYGALGEYLSIYDDIKPDLKAIDKMFGSPVVEAEPYHEDMAAARLAQKRFAAAMEAAEKASPSPIAQHGVESMNKGRAIWSVVQLKTRRNLVDAWLFWGVPDRCDATAKSLKTRSNLLGQALAFSAPKLDAPARPAAEAPTPMSDKPDPAAISDGPAPANPSKPD